MASGVPEHEVWAAADVVLARGERPTVERVRTELGRGSPARVGQLLEQWWEQLAQRLKGHALLPELPGEVAQAFAEIWRLALAEGDAFARAALTDDRNAFAAAQADLAHERDVWANAISEAHAGVTEHAAQRALAERQLGERQILVDRLAAQVTDLTQQRDRLQSQLEQSKVELGTLRSEQAGTQDYVRKIEDRAHQQVDRVGQEVKELQQRMKQEQRDHKQQVGQLMTQIDELRKASRTAEQSAARYEGRVSALEAALASERTSPKRSTSKKATVPASKARNPSKRPAM